MHVPSPVPSPFNSSRARKGGSYGSFCRSAEVKQDMRDKFSASTWGHTLGHRLSQAVNAHSQTLQRWTTEQGLVGKPKVTSTSSYFNS